MYSSVGAWSSGVVRQHGHHQDQGDVPGEQEAGGSHVLGPGPGRLQRWVSDVACIALHGARTSTRVHARELKLQGVCHCPHNTPPLGMQPPPPSLHTFLLFHGLGYTFIYGCGAFFPTTRSRLRCFLFPHRYPLITAARSKLQSKYDLSSGGIFAS